MFRLCFRTVESWCIENFGLWRKISSLQVTVKQMSGMAAYAPKKPRFCVGDPVLKVVDMKCMAYIYITLPNSCSIFFGFGLKSCPSSDIEWNVALVDPRVPLVVACEQDYFNETSYGGDLVSHLHFLCRIKVWHCDEIGISYYTFTGNTLPVELTTKFIWVGSDW